jgi:hypothetical protein
MTLHSFLQSIASAPWWGLPLFLYLMHMAYRANRPREVYVRALLLAPMLFILMSFIGMTYFIKVTPMNIKVWADMLLLGLGLGWLHFSAIKVMAISGQKKLQMPGTWLIMILVPVVFALKWHFGLTGWINPRMFDSPKVALYLMGVYGFFSGLFLGRAAYALRSMKLGPFTDPLEPLAQ